MDILLEIITLLLGGAFIYFPSFFMVFGAHYLINASGGIFMEKEDVPKTAAESGFLGLFIGSGIGYAMLQERSVIVRLAFIGTGILYLLLFGKMCDKMKKYAK